MSNIKKRRKWNKHGVSEIIGNILILGITVTLFSSIMWFVTAMPTPQEHAYADMTSELNMGYSGVLGGWADISVTHKGGQELKNDSIGIYIWINDTQLFKYNITDDPAIGTSWITGEVWHTTIGHSAFPVGKDPNKARISLIIIDKVKNSEVYSVTLNGGDNAAPPIIGTRGITPSPTYEGDSFYFYATVMDPNNDLNENSVYVDISSLNLNPIVSVKMTDSNHDGVFTAGPFTAITGYNGKVVIVNATDLGGRESVGRITISILRSSTNIFNNNTYNNNSQLSNLNFSGNQGFGIFLKEDWDVNRFNAKPRQIFDRGQVAVVVIASIHVVNAESQNSLMVTNITTGQTLTAVSSPANIFETFGVVSGYHVFTIEIKTNLLPKISTSYYLRATLVDNDVPNHFFQMNSWIYVNTAALPPTTIYPKFTTYSSASFADATKSDNFTTYNPNSNIIYVEVLTKNGGSWVNNSGVVEIRDFGWNSQLRSTPYTPTGSYPPYQNSDIKGWIGGVSNVWQADYNRYRFAINLVDVFGSAPWIPGENAYILKYDIFQSGTETYLLTKVINIDAPTTKLDLVVGGTPVKSARFSYQGSLYFYLNENHWSPPSVLETTTDKQTYNPTVFAIKACDINGDARTDFVAILQDTVQKNKDTPKLFVYLQNSAGNFDKYLITTLIHPVNNVKLSTGNTGLGSTQDVCVGYADGLVELYKNNGAWTRLVVDSTTSSAVNSLAVANMAPPGSVGMDLNRSMDIIIGRADGTMTVFKNANGVGTSWTAISLNPSSTTNTQEFASGEDSGQYVVGGTYLDTTSQSQLPYVYEALKELPVYRLHNTTPAGKGPLDNCTDFITQLTPGGSDPYTVLGTRTASVIKWDTTYLIDDVQTMNVSLEVRYRTNGPNNGLDWMKLNMGGTISNMVHIQNTNGEWTTARFNLTGLFPQASAITDLNVTYTNTNPSSTSVDFMYWSVNITWATGDALEHKYNFAIPSTASSYTFSLYALRQSGNDGDVISVSYSIDGGTSYKAFPSPIIISAVGYFGHYVSSIPTSDILTAGGLIKIKVAASTVISASPGFPQVWMGQMMITCNGVAATSVGTLVKDMAIDDMNGDGSNDIVVLGYTGTNGRIVVFRNTAGNSIFLPINAVTIGSIPAGIINIGTGNIFNPYSKHYKDIAYSNQTTVHFINQTSIGTYVKSSFTLAPGFNLVKIMVVDIEGNGRADILMAGTDRIAYYSNYLGYEGAKLGTTVAWNMIYVDSSLIGSSGFTCMDCRKFSVY